MKKSNTKPKVKSRTALDSERHVAERHGNAVTSPGTASNKNPETELSKNPPTIHRYTMISRIVDPNDRESSSRHEAGRGSSPDQLPLDHVIVRIRDAIERLLETVSAHTIEVPAGRQVIDYPGGEVIAKSFGVTLKEIEALANYGPIPDELVAAFTRLFGVAFDRSGHGKRATKEQVLEGRGDLFRAGDVVTKWQMGVMEAAKRSVQKLAKDRGIGASTEPRSHRNDNGSILRKVGAPFDQQNRVLDSPGAHGSSRLGRYLTHSNTPESLIYGDSVLGEVDVVLSGTSKWAILKILIERRADASIDYADLERQAESVLGRWRDDARGKMRDDLLAAEAGNIRHRLRRRRRRRDDGNRGSTAKQRIQAVLRKGCEFRDKARRWREFWLRWETEGLSISEDVRELSGMTDENSQKSH